MLHRAQAVIGALQHFSDYLIGADPMRIGGLWQEMYRSQYFEGGRTLTAAISAIDIARHDIAGKKLGVPVYQLLGGRQRDWVPCFATVQKPTIEENIAGAELLQTMKSLLAPAAEGGAPPPPGLLLVQGVVADAAGGAPQGRSAGRPGRRG